MLPHVGGQVQLVGHALVDVRWAERLALFSQHIEERKEQLTLLG